VNYISNYAKIVINHWYIVIEYFVLCRMGLISLIFTPGVRLLIMNSDHIVIIQSFVPIYGFARFRNSNQMYQIKRIGAVLIRLMASPRPSIEP